jgi:tRNA A-37 threonylcarbamoyl transferase component Bud32
MGNIDSTNLDAISTERLRNRSWRKGNPESPTFNALLRKSSTTSVFGPNSAASSSFASAFTGPTTSASTSSPIRKSLSTGNLADHAIFPPGDSSLVPMPHVADEEVDLELAAFRKLCHDITTHLIGPQFVMSSAPATPSPPPHEAQHAASAQTDAPPELLPSPPPPKLVVNHLYNPVLQKVKEHMGGLPEWYQVKTQASEAANHIRLLLEARKYEAGRVAVSVGPLMDEHGPQQGMYVVVVCARDRRQLLDAITRCVSQRASIIEATIITTRDGFALDRFVMRREEESDYDGQASEDDVAFWGESLKRDIEEVIGSLPPSPQASGGRKRTSRRTPSAIVPVPAPKPAWEVPFQEIRLIRVLGQGTTGRTFLAEWRGERVAAKVLSLEDDSINSGIRLEQFQSELALVSRLSHPNVVKFVGASARPPRYIILFELCVGDVLQLVRAKKQRYSFFQIALGAAQGLAYLHRNRVMHRDVKPENLMLDKVGRVKVVDFGLSCYVGDKSPERTAETGTYRYMAPEVMLHQTYSFPADVYSFGMVMWVLLVRKVPFEESTPLQTAMAVSRSGARPKLPATAPPALHDLIKQCWDKDPEARPAFDEVILVLEAIRKTLGKKDKNLLDWEEGST